MIGTANTLAAAHYVYCGTPRPAGGSSSSARRTCPRRGKRRSGLLGIEGSARPSSPAWAALEWATDGITVNIVHPDGVFDTGLWSDELIADRAASYGLTPEQYRRRNLLGRELASPDVGALIAQMCGPAFAHTTGAQIPQDGGSDRVV